MKIDLENLYSFLPSLLQQFEKKNLAVTVTAIQKKNRKKDGKFWETFEIMT